MAITLSSTSPLMERLRRSGRCTPSLLRDEADASARGADAFDESMMSIMEAGGVCLKNDTSAGKSFQNLLKTLESLDNIPGTSSVQKTSLLVQRRSVMLAIAGATSSNNAALRFILTDGYLIIIKTWLDDVLIRSIGGVDFLLHLLDNIIHLPVTKEMVATSKLGKAVVSIEKFKICSGGNMPSIKDRIVRLKSAWSKSVKSLRNPNKTEDNVSPTSTPTTISSTSQKRPLETTPTTRSSSSSSIAGSNAKKSKTSVMSTSNLLSKVSGQKRKIERTITPSAAEVARLRAQERKEKDKSRLASLTVPRNSHSPEQTPIVTSSQIPRKQEESVQPAPKRPGRRIRWADGAGLKLCLYHDRQVSEEEWNQLELTTKEGGQEVKGISWTDQKKRDRLREKEHLEKSRELTNTVKQEQSDALITNSINPPLVTWIQPRPLSLTNDPIIVVSNELTKLTTRLSSVMPVHHSSMDKIPSNPTPLSDIEIALDMASQASSTPAVISFFIPSPPEDIKATTDISVPMVPQPQPSIISPNLTALMSSSNRIPPPPPHMTNMGASMELVQVLGLPLFLVGSNVQALNTLAATPNLLNTFVDEHGMYDQVRLLNLVSTLAQSLQPQLPGRSSQPPPYGNVNPGNGAVKMHQYGLPNGLGGGPNMFSSPPPPPPMFQQAAHPTASSYAAPPQSSSLRNNQPPSQPQQGGGLHPKGYRGEQNTGEGNLHLSGYGPSTTQVEIMAIFSPYVKVEEIVSKNGFSFVNTRDARGAARAREALNGAIMGGRPVRINIATRRVGDGENGKQVKGRGGRDTNPDGSSGGALPLPMNMMNGDIDYDAVRDDRGNPSTKNLFVAGYGHGTSEQELRDLFSQHAKVSGCVIKGSFAFVNTSDKNSAVRARNALTGTLFNGGVLRINFAKESGRLGTSFDSTYGPSGAGRSTGGGGGGGSGSGSGSHSQYMRN